MRCVLILALLFMVLGSAGCLISTQVGERVHINAPPPDEMTFHFNTFFNHFILFGRSAVLLLFACWVFSGSRKGGFNLFAWTLAGIALSGSVYLMIADAPTVFTYRIEIGKDQVQLHVPRKIDLAIRWEDIKSLEAGKKVWDVKYGVVERAFTWETAWEGMAITTRDGRKHQVDLRPLSVEQRGIVWSLIGRRAHVGVRDLVEKN